MPFPCRFYKFCCPPQPTISLSNLILYIVRKFFPWIRKFGSPRVKSFHWTKQFYLQSLCSSSAYPSQADSEGWGTFRFQARTELMRRLVPAWTETGTELRGPFPVVVSLTVSPGVWWFPEDFFCLIQSLSVYSITQLLFVVMCFIGWCNFFLSLCTFIEVFFIKTILRHNSHIIKFTFIMYNSIVSSKFTEFYEHHHGLLLENFYYCKKKSHAHEQSLWREFSKMKYYTKLLKGISSGVCKTHSTR